MNILKDLEKTKKAHERIIEVAKKEKEHFYNIMKPKGYSTGTSYLDADLIKGSNKEVDLIKIVEEITRLDNLIYIEQSIIDNTEKEIIKVKKELGAVEGIQLKIKNMQMIEGLTLKQIAVKLNYSYSYVRKLVMKRNN